MKLHGTTTSPFVRRVRVVAAEAGQPFELILSRPDSDALRQVSPIWKVPAAEVDGRVIFDSRVIIDWITTTRGWGGIEPPRDRWREANLINAIDGALESAVQVFYLRRDGIDVTNLPFANRQRDRITEIFDWLGRELEPDRVGLPQISLVCTLDWMDFRSTFETGDRFARLRTLLGSRPSIEKTKPHE